MDLRSFSLALLFGISACAFADAAADSRHAKHGKHGRKHGAHGAKHHEHHRFEDAEEWAKRFEDPERDAWQKPEDVLDALKLEPHHRVADIGSATGYFPVRAAKRVSAGRVWGVDIEPTMIRFLNQRAQAEGIENLFSVLGTFEDPLIPEPVDRILIVDTYHHISDRVAYFKRVASYLREGGQLVVVDFKKGELPFGPSDEMKLAPEEVDAELGEAGYRRVGALDGLPYQYVLIFERS